MSDGQLDSRQRETALAFPTSGPPGPPLLSGPCRNCVCPTYNAGVLGKSVDHTEGMRCARVRCPVCGFTYHFSVTAPHRYRIEEVGSLWCTKLREMADAGFSPNRAARQFGIYRITMRRLAERYGVKLAEPSTAKWALSGVRGGARSTSAAAQRVQAAREAYMEYAMCHPTATRMQLRTDLGRVFQRLWRSDRVWLDRLLPTRRRRVRNTADWEERDACYIALIPDIAASILRESAPSIRITAQRIIKRLPSWTIRTRRACLPRTWECIRMVVESTSEFAARRAKLSAHSDV